jgi:dynein heavy chain 1
MLHIDRLTFALLLCRIHMKGVPNQPSLDQEFAFFLRGKEGMLTSKPPTMEGLSQDQLEALFRMSTRYCNLPFLSDGSDGFRVDCEAVTAIRCTKIRLLTRQHTSYP